MNIFTNRTTNSNITRLIKLLTILLLSPFFAASQTDTEFWFAVPYATQAHTVPQGGGGGGRPVSLTIAAEEDAIVHITVPNADFHLTVELNEIDGLSRTVELTDYMEYFVPRFQNGAVVGNIIDNKALHIYTEENRQITAYYEIGAVLNPDIFALKGQNALGTEFYTPFQNMFHNCFKYNLSPHPFNQDGYDLDNINDAGGMVDSAFSAFYIVATEDNTVVTITPTNSMVGRPVNVPFSVTLQRGQTYIGRASGQNANQHLSGTRITATKPIAVTIGDDSVEDQNLRGFPEYITSYYPTYEDYNGDQLIPIEILGYEYIVIKGGVGAPADNQLYNGYRLTEHVFIGAVENNTQILINGAGWGAPMQAGEVRAYNMDNSIYNDYAFIESLDEKKFYVYHLSGYGPEMAGAILPPVSSCTGSYNVNFSRTTGTLPSEVFRMNLMVKERGINSFTIDGQNIIPSNIFRQVEGSDWMVGSIELPLGTLGLGQHLIENSLSSFHLGIISTTAHDWGNGYDRMGANYGYFSNFTNEQQDAFFVSRPEVDTLYTPDNVDVELRATGGFAYTWNLYRIENGQETLINDNLTDLTGRTTSTFGLDTGSYKVTVFIDTDEPFCGTDTLINRFIEVLPPWVPPYIADMMCLNVEENAGSDVNLSVIEDSFYDNRHTCYDLNNLNDYILAQADNRLGVEIEGYYTRIANNVLELNEVGTWTAINGVSRQFSTDRDAYYFSGNNAQGYAQLRMPTGEYLDFSQGSSVFLELTPFEVYGSVTIQMMAIGSNGTAYPAIQRTISGDVFPTRLRFEYPMDIVFTEDEKIRELRFTIFGEGSAPIQLEIGDFIWESDYVFTLVENEDCLIMYNNDAYYARVIGDFISVEDFWYSAIDFYVRTGRDLNEILIDHLCATTDSTYLGYDLTQHRYEDIGGSLVADKEWYTHPSRDEIYRIQNPENYTARDGDTVYVKVWDVCARTNGMVIFDIERVSNPQSQTIELCSDIDATSVQDVDLHSFNSRIEDVEHHAFEWFTDAGLTTPVSNPNNITINDEDVFFVKVGILEGCMDVAEISFKIIPTYSLTFEPFADCATYPEFELEALPVHSKGIFRLSGQEITSFNPSEYGAGTYSIEYSIIEQGNEISCPSSIVAEYVVYPNPVISLSIPEPDNRINFESSITITLTSDIPVQLANGGWSPADMLVNPTALSPTTQVLIRPQTYTVNVVDVANGCPANATISIDVEDVEPVIDELNSVAYCQGEDAEMQAIVFGGTSQAHISGWRLTPSVPYTTNADSTIIYVADVQETIEAIVRYYDPADGRFDIDTAYIYVYERPQVTFESLSYSVCPSIELPIDGTVVYGSTNGSTQGTWTGVSSASPRSNLTNISGTYSEDAVFQSSVPGQYSYNYELTATYQTDINTPLNCSIEQVIDVRVYPQPAVTVNHPTEKCFGQTEELEALPSGGQLPYTHSWRDADGGTLYVENSLSNINIINPVFSALYTGMNNIQYTLTDANGCEVEYDFGIMVYNKPEVVLPSDTVLCQQDEVLSILAEAGAGSLPYIYTWTGANLNSTSNGQNFVTVSEPGLFPISVFVRDANGCESNPDNMNVRVNPNPIAAINVIGQQNAEICMGQPLQLRADDNFEDVIQYSWSGNTVTPTTGRFVTFVGSGASSTEYITLDVLNTSTGCESQDIIPITVRQQPSIPFIADTTVCLNDVARFRVPQTVSSNTNRWSVINPEGDTLEVLVGDNISQQVTEMRDYDFMLISTNEYGCSDTATMTADAYPLPNAVIIPRHNNGEVASNNGDAATFFYEVSFTLDGSTSTCADGTTNCGLTYEWYSAEWLTTANNISEVGATLNNDETSVYPFELKVTDNNTCTSRVEQIIIIEGDSTALDVLPITLCEDEIGSLQAYATGGNGPGTYTYSWYDNDGNVIVENSPTDSIIPVSFSEAGVYTYTVVVNFEDFPSETREVTITVNPNPVFTVSEPREVCQNGQLPITAIIENPELYDYTWTLQGATAESNDNPYMFSNTAIPGNYFVNLNVRNSITECSTDSLVDVLVNPNPVFEIIRDMGSVCQDSIIHYYAELYSEIIEPYDYSWYINDRLYSTDPEIFYSPLVNGDLGVNDVRLDLIDGNGCENTEFLYFEVKPVLSLIPNFPSPICSNEEVVIEFPDISRFNQAVFVEWNTPFGVEQFTTSERGLRAVFTPNIDDIGVYEFTYTIDDSRYNCPFTNTISIDVRAGVNVIVPPISKCSFDNVASFYPEIEFYGDQSVLLYNWTTQASEINILGRTTRNAQVTGNEPGTYNVDLAVSAQNGCTANANSTVTINPNPIVEIFVSVPQVNDFVGSADTYYRVTENAVAPLNAYVVNEHRLGLPFTYQWNALSGSGISTGSNLSSEAVNTNPITMSSTYYLTVTDANGCIGTQLINFELLNAPIVELAANNVCYGDSSLVRISFPEIQPIRPTYAWYKDEIDSANIISTSVGAIWVKPTVTTTYYLVVTDYLGNRTTGSFEVQVFANPRVDLITYPSMNGVFFTEVDINMYADVTYGTSTVIPEGNEGWSSSPESYIDSLHVQDTNMRYAMYNSEFEDSYSFSYSVEDANGCKASDSYSYSPRRLPLLMLNYSSICKGEYMEVSVSSTDMDYLYMGGTFVWDIPNNIVEVTEEYYPDSVEIDTNIVKVFHFPDGAGVYDISVVEVGHPDTLIPRPAAYGQLVVRDYPNVIIIGPQNVCEFANTGYTTEITNIPYVDSAYVIYSSPYYRDEDTLQSITTYFVSYDWDVVFDSVYAENGQLLNYYTITDSIDIRTQWAYAGFDTVKVTAFNSYKYQLFINDTLFSESTYSCPNTNVLPVQVHEAPKPVFEFNPKEEIYIADPIEFTNLSAENPDNNITSNVTFHWDFIGDGVFTEETVGDESITYYYNDMGVFAVTLYAIDAETGCSSSYTDTLEVIPNKVCDIIFPNAFTPDLSEGNEFYPVYTKGIQDEGYSLRIFNRWGELLWETNDRYAKWDGIHNGKDAKQDTYVYHCQATCEDGTVKNKNGSVDIFR